MQTTNDSQVSVGDAFIKKAESGSKFTVNRIEKTVTESGAEQINSVRLRQIAPIVLETEEERKTSRYRNPSGIKSIFIDCTLEELNQNYTLAYKRDRAGSLMVREIISTKEETRNMLHRIDEAVKMLRDSQNHDAWNSRKLGEESLHLDVAYLNETLGQIVMFKQNRWLARLIYFIDKFGKNYSASMSSSDYEAKEGYGFVTISTKNKLKKSVINVLAKFLEKLNSNSRFTKPEFVNYPNAAWEEEDSYSMKDLVENKHRAQDKWYMEYQEKYGIGKEAVVGTELTGFVQNSKELTQVKVNIDKLPTNEEVLEQTRLMQQYEDEIVRQAEEAKHGKQSGPELQPIITPQIGE